MGGGGTLSGHGPGSRYQQTRKQMATDPEADGGGPPGAGGWKQVSGRAPCGLGGGSSPVAGRRSRAGSTVSAPPPGRAGLGSIQKEGALGPGPLCTELGLRRGWGLRRRPAGLGSRLRPRPGPARPGSVRRAPGVYGRAEAAKGTCRSRFAGILSAAFSRRPRLASLLLEKGT